MAFRKVILERVPSIEEVLTISKTGLYFGAEFIRANQIEKKLSVSFFVDDEDPYRIGFEFYNEVGREHSLVLMNTGNATNKGRTVKASEFINKNKILLAIQKDPIKTNRLFTISKERGTEIYYVCLRPSFENRVTFADRNTIDENLSGIYRYRDKDGKIIYIGKGLIKTRSNSQERRDWGVLTIEYSIIGDEEASLKWESFYIDSHLSEHQQLPVFNRIAGHK